MTSKRHRWPCAEPVKAVADAIIAAARQQVDPSGAFHRGTPNHEAVGKIALAIVPRVDCFTDLCAARKMGDQADELEEGAADKLGSNILNCAWSVLRDRAHMMPAPTVEDAIERVQAFLDDIEDFAEDDAMIEGKVRAMAGDIRKLAAGRLPRRATVVSAQVARKSRRRPAVSMEARP